MTNRTLKIALIISVVTACGSDRVHRTDLRAWKTVERPAEGIAMDIPADASNFPAGGSSFLMHYRSNGVADATWFIGFGIKRKTASELDTPFRPSSDNPVSSDAEYTKWLTWLEAYHERLSVLEREDERHYRRDIRLPNGDVASIHATYRYGPFSEPDRVADDAAIRRIVNSARAISK